MINLISLMLLLLSATYRRPYTKLGRASLVGEKSAIIWKISHTEWNLTWEATNTSVHTAKVLQVFSKIKSKSWLQSYLKPVSEELQVKPTYADTKETLNWRLFRVTRDWPGISNSSLWLHH